MAGNNKKKWTELANEMKQKRQKWSNDSGSKRQKMESTPAVESILAAKELTVQLLATEPTGTSKKYCRLGPQEFVEFKDREVSIESLKKACFKHFNRRIPAGMVCDLLASGRGPSCFSFEKCKAHSCEVYQGRR